MALEEADIIRYSRQILLREVGGAGQQRLLAARVAVRGEGPALEVARAYAEASGVRIHPDAPGLWLAAAPVREPLPRGDAVVLGLDGRGSAVVLVRRDGDCGACFLAECGGLAALQPGPLAVQAGAHAALALQRLVLGMSPPPAPRTALRPDGVTESHAAPPCPGHAP